MSDYKIHNGTITNLSGGFWRFDSGDYVATLEFPDGSTITIKPNRHLIFAEDFADKPTQAEEIERLTKELAKEKEYSERMYKSDQQRMNMLLERGQELERLKGLLEKAGLMVKPDCNTKHTWGATKFNHFHRGTVKVCTECGMSELYFKEVNR